MKNTTLENCRKVTVKKPQNILDDLYDNTKRFSLSRALEISGKYLLLRKVLLQKKVVGCR